jgi:hypothetical protein
MPVNNGDGALFPDAHRSHAPCQSPIYAALGWQKIIATVRGYKTGDAQPLADQE